jgi:hypothetical protein
MLTLGNSRVPTRLRPTLGGTMITGLGLGASSVGDAKAIESYGKA